MKSIINSRVVVLIILFLYQNKTFSQEYSSTSKEEFMAYIQQQDLFYQNLIDQNNGSSEGISGYKSYMRWKTRYSEEAYNSDGMQNVISSEFNFNNNYRKYIKSIDTEQTEWEELGPVRRPLFFRSEGYESKRYRTEGVGRIFSIEFDPTNSNRVFVGSPTGGLYYSEDHGETWTNGGTDQLPNPGISHIKIVPASSDFPETWFILTGDGDNAWSYSYGILRSQNKGQSWENISNGINIGNYTYGRKMLQNLSNPNEMFVILSSGLYKTDSALYSNVNWYKIEDPSFSDMHFTDICYKPNSNYQTLYVASRDSIFISENAGQTFSAMPNLMESMFLYNTSDTHKENVRITLRTTAANTNILYAVIINDTNNSQAVVYKYNENNNNIWLQKGKTMPYDTIINNNPIEIEPIGFGRYQGFAVSPSNEAILYKSRIQHIYKSINSGETWELLSDDKHDDTHWICFENENPDNIWLGTDGGIHFTNDDFNNIEDKTNGIGVANVFNVSASHNNPNTIIMGAWDCGSNLLHADSSDWGVISSGDGFKGLINDNYQDSIKLHCSSSGVSPLRSIEVSPTYKFIQWFSGDSIIGTKGWPHNMACDYTNNDIIYYPGRYRIGRSIDNGITWEAISPMASIDSLNVFYMLIEKSRNNRDVLYVTKIKMILLYQKGSIKS